MTHCSIGEDMILAVISFNNIEAAGNWTCRCFAIYSVDASPDHNKLFYLVKNLTHGPRLHKNQTRVKHIPFTSLSYEPYV